MIGGLASVWLTDFRHLVSENKFAATMSSLRWLGIAKWIIYLPSLNGTAYVFKVNKSALERHSSIE